MVAGKVATELLGELVEPTLLQPTFLCDYPASAQPLARPHRSDPGPHRGVGPHHRRASSGVPASPSWSTRSSSVSVLTAQSRLAAGGDEEAMQLDEDFLRALEYGAPPMGGLGLGMDRMVMFFTGANIRETILFPLLKPEA